MSAAGIGALLATMYLASRKNARGLIKIIPVAAAACAAWGLPLSPSGKLCLLHNLPLPGRVLHDDSHCIQQYDCKTRVDEDKRGRIMSLHAMSFMGVMPFGSILAGSIADRIVIQFTMLLGAAFCIIGASIFAFKLPMFCELLRPVFATMEIRETEHPKSEHLTVSGGKSCKASH